MNGGGGRPPRAYAGSGAGAVRFRPDTKSGGGGGGAVCFRSDTKSGGGDCLPYDDLYLGLCARACGMERGGGGGGGGGNWSQRAAFRMNGRGGGGGGSRPPPSLCWIRGWGLLSRGSAWGGSPGNDVRSLRRKRLERGLVHAQPGDPGQRPRGAVHKRQVSVRQRQRTAQGRMQDFGEGGGGGPT